MKLTPIKLKHKLAKMRPRDLLFRMRRMRQPKFTPPATPVDSHTVDILQPGQFDDLDISNIVNCFCPTIPIVDSPLSPIND